MSFLNKLKNGIKIEIGTDSTKKLDKKTPKKQAPNTEKTEKLEDEQWLDAPGELIVDVYQEGNKIVIQAPVAGIKIEDLDIEIENDTIKIQGKRNKTHKVDTKDYFLQECYWGSFAKEIILPFEVNGSKAEASMQQGILTIKAPKKRATVKSTKIKIKEK